MTLAMVLWFIFNPIAMLSPATDNLQIVNHCLLVSIYYLAVFDRDYSIVRDILCGLAIYVDPTTIYCLIPILIIRATVYKNSTTSLYLSFGISIGIFSLLVATSGAPLDEIRNYQNILYVRDHSENLGFFWYIFVEVFTQHVEFYQHIYLIFISILSIQMTIMFKMLYASYISMQHQHLS